MLVQFSRRDFLRIGSLALGGLSLPQLLAARAAAAGLGDAVRDKSVVFLMMAGGPPQQETFDPKPDAPQEVRTMTGTIPTSLPSVRFGDYFPKLARLADRLAVIRSFATESEEHEPRPITSPQTLNANLGSLYSAVIGTSHPRTGLPTNVLLTPRAIDAKADSIFNLQHFQATGNFGPAHAPFMPGGASELLRNMQLKLPTEHIAERRSLLQQLDRLQRSVDSGGAMASLDRFQTQAIETILGGGADGLDLSRESSQVVARYDTARLVNPQSIGKRWSEYRKYLDHNATLGKKLLLARRLCERGCGFVTIANSLVWDFHADPRNADVKSGLSYIAPTFDHAVSAFIEDCEARGLGEKILLICASEMGRTPKINKDGGREHWGRITPLLVYGGGLRMGQVIGQSTRDGGEPNGNRYTRRHLLGTIFHTLFDVGQLRLQSGVPKPIVDLAGSHDPIAELF
ncbi:MAG: DUF1501 domain-containing protein [Planctomycetia bacterium]|nr:DUF1501 domain-containing protein [Planctomycetia bacterium]